jgi:two-component system chemotaxis sensor kinase CheA
VVVSVAVRGEVVELAVSDDGQGLDMKAIRQQVSQRNMPFPEDSRAAAHLVFSAGFSTAATITEVSGRGVGLDVVKTEVERLRGSVKVTFEPGRGTRFTLTLPLTLTTIRALVIETGGHTFAIPSADVRRLLRIEAGVVRTIAGREVILLGGAPVPLASLASLLGVTARRSATPEQRIPVVVLAVDGEVAAISTDGLVAEQEIVVKSLGPRLRKLKFVSGATMMPTGGVALVLSAADLVRHAASHRSAASFAETAQQGAKQAPKRLILADDSLTTRTLEKTILEAAGYEVLTAVDGSAAWHLLQDKGADLVVSDVEMPTMDGFSLTQAIRSSQRFHGVPVILVTALETDGDRARGLESGADAYLPKSTFDQKALLETIRQLL